MQVFATAPDKPKTHHTEHAFSDKNGNFTAHGTFSLLFISSFCSINIGVLRLYLQNEISHNSNSEMSGQHQS
jgi:hypothetical protein